MNTKYSYNKLCDSERLKQEIRFSSIVTALDYITTQNNPALTEVYFKAELSTTDVSILEGLISVHVNIPLIENEIMTVKLDTPKTTTGITKVSIYEAEGSGATVVSFNYADPSSWYSCAKPIVNETLTLDSGTTYLTAQKNLIDLTHGRCYDEDNIMASNGNKWAFKVYVDGVLKTEDAIYKTALTDTPESLLRDYSVDYKNGRITFHTAPTGVVTASYYYADKSYYSIRPKPGKILSIKTAEVQCSVDTKLNGIFVFEPWFVGHPIYGTMAIPGQQIAYKNAKDFISACNEGQGVITKWGELTKDVSVFPFDYARPKPLKYPDNIEIRVYIKNHLPPECEYATVTFYVTIDDITT